MATGDIFQITATTKVFGQDTVNVWYARANDETATAELIVDGWIENTIPELQPLFTSKVNFTSISVKNLFDEVDAFEESIGMVGTKSSSADMLPTHDALGVVLNHDNPSIRSGAKRFGGIVESNSDEYGAVASATVVEFDTALNGMIATGVSRNISETLAETIAEFVIVKAIPVIVEGVTGYRLPNNITEAVFGFVTSAFIKPNVTTQVSRKVGKGS